MSEKVTYKGVDISSWQRDLVDGAILKRGGISFAILKVTEGRTVKDVAFSSHYNMCKGQGIPVGAYVFSHAIGAAGGKAEAEFALSVLAGRKLDLPIYLDIEAEAMLSSGKAAIMAAARAFGDTMKAAGYKVGVYASRSRYGAYIDAEALRNEGYSIWCAAYNNSGAGMSCDIWQHTDKGRLAGYGGNLDFNILYNAALLNGASVAPQTGKDTAPTQEKAEVAQAQIKLYHLAKGSEGEQVKAMQALLIKKFGIGCGISGADGDFGTRTDEAVRKFQKAKGLTVDGICGQNTWTALLK